MLLLAQIKTWWCSGSNVCVCLETEQNGRKMTKIRPCLANGGVTNVFAFVIRSNRYNMGIVVETPGFCFFFSKFWWRIISDDERKRIWNKHTKKVTFCAQRSKSVLAKYKNSSQLLLLEQISQPFSVSFVPKSKQKKTNPPMFVKPISYNSLKLPHFFPQQYKNMSFGIKEWHKNVISFEMFYNARERDKKRLTMTIIILLTIFCYIHVFGVENCLSFFLFIRSIHVSCSYKCNDKKVNEIKVKN